MPKQSKHTKKTVGDYTLIHVLVRQVLSFIIYCLNEQHQSRIISFHFLYQINIRVEKLEEGERMKNWKKYTIAVLIICTFIVLLWKIVLPRIFPINIEVTITHSVTKQIGTSYYTFELYSYGEELTGVYLLRVEKGNDFETKVIVAGHTYRFFDLEVHVVKLIIGGVLLEVKKV